LKRPAHPIAVCTPGAKLPVIMSSPASQDRGMTTQVDSTAQTLQYVKHSKMAVISRYLRGIQCLM